ncbi:MAG: DNA repair protein RecN [Armatimonadota bacterium]|nr:DNA repair protein RecN [Armatimonadota bacterium]MDR7387180.1 DNA repair protein RecN [Armatimonadota bacterium]MDR7389427.1 DNA repair protein RecN [Armatimonadota bacterium]MDR7392419.1 DNA repair protein RecN [Armatimonadota bacterium]MDR7396981.1 DNA repair protein RecN [Armatimonadota bacterium]
MLRELHVRDFVLLDDVQVEFGPGLNVLTGETGAGKSMLVDALGAVLGQRTPSDVVRTGASSARVVAVFEAASVPQLRSAVDELGLPWEDGALVLVREIGGRARAYVNGQPTTVGVLRRLGTLLAEIHGQHEGQRLLEPASHRELLDAFGGGDLLSLRARTEELFGRWRQLRSELRALDVGERERAQRVDLLRFQISEIDSVRPRPGELEELVGLRTRMVNAERLRESVAAAYQALYGDEGAAADRVGRAVVLLRQAASWDPALLPLVEALESAEAQLRDLAREVHAAVERAESDPVRLEEVESRLAALRALLRKYGDTVEAVLDFRETAARELAALENADSRRAELEQQVATVEAELASAVRDLSAARSAAARRLEKAILQHLQDLAMPGARFRVRLDVDEDPDGLPVGGRRVGVAAWGADRVEFLLSTNPGEPPRPLHRVASGGELSRVMLALRTVLARADPPAVMVFDEVDSGVGGRTGHVIGAKLSELAGVCQVLCVTHLPQIAALGHHHLAIRKVTERGRTRTVVEVLDREARVEEIARMLSGPSPTETARRHARELLGC